MHGAPHPNLVAPNCKVFGGFSKVASTAHRTRINLDTHHTRFCPHRIAGARLSFHDTQLQLQPRRLLLSAQGPFTASPSLAPSPLCLFAEPEEPHAGHHFAIATLSLKLQLVSSSLHETCCMPLSPSACASITYLSQCHTSSPSISHSEWPASDHARNSQYPASSRGSRIYLPGRRRYDFPSSTHKHL